MPGILKEMAKRSGGAHLKGLWQISRARGALAASGWIASLKRGFPSDSRGNPVPWISYPAITFLAHRVRPTFSVFEFGTGYSTLWWSRYAQSVVTCEHDPHWAQTIKSRMPANVEMVTVPLDVNYPSAIARTGRTFDVVVVDGRKRAECAIQATVFLKEGGVLVWDDSDRDRYQEGIKTLLSSGYRKLDFVGLSPLVPELKQTSIFYKDHNCLEI
jgi:hypothetical protein